MSIRFLTKQEPSTFDEDVQSATTSPWIRLDVKQEVSEFSYNPVQQQINQTSLPLFQRPQRVRNPSKRYLPSPTPINTFEDVIEAIKSGRAPSVDPLRRSNKKLTTNNNRPNVVIPRPPISRSSFEKEYTPYSLESTLDRIRPSSSRSSSYSDVELGSGKKYSLSCLSNNEIKERKKEQNILAARRYRQKRNELLNERKEEIDKLEKRKTELQILEASLAGQIQALKDLFAEQLKQRVGGATAAFVDTKEPVKHSAAVQASVDDITVEGEKESKDDDVAVQALVDDIEVDGITVESEKELMEKEENDTFKVGAITGEKAKEDNAAVQASVDGKEVENIVKEVFEEEEASDMQDVKASAVEKEEPMEEENSVETSHIVTEEIEA